MSDVETAAGRAALRAVCEAATPWSKMSWANRSAFIALARTALPEAIEYIERLERAATLGRAQNARLAETLRDVRTLIGGDDEYAYAVSRIDAALGQGGGQ